MLGRSGRQWATSGRLSVEDAVVEDLRTRSPVGLAVLALTLPVKP